jgi:hypothetical protein
MLMAEPPNVGNPNTPQTSIMMNNSFAKFCVLATGILAAPALSFAGKETVPDKKVIVAPEESRYKFYGHVEGGITFNPDRPKDNQNFGMLTTDRANEPMLNQFMLTFERALKPEPGQFDWGFKVQGLFGSDARFFQTLGTLDNTMHERYQPALIEAYVSAHLPVLTEGGIDLKLGQFVTLEGIEVIPTTGNYFYSHAYITNFGVPFQHTGLMTITHATKWLDVYAGVVRGVNGALDDNNDVLSFHGGFGFNLLDGKLIIMATTSIGAENDAINELAGVDTNSDMRYLSDVAITWKITDKLTSMTDLNYAYDAGFGAEAYGVAQWLTYQFNDYFSLGIRGEIFRDDDGFFVLQSGNNEDFIKLQRGIGLGIDPRTVFGGDTTYAEVTFGANIRLPGALKDRVLIRPEIRYDSAIAGARNKPYDDSSDHDQFTASFNVVVAF